LYSNNHHVVTLKSFFFNDAGASFAMLQGSRANPYENPNQNPIPIEKPFFYSYAFIKRYFWINP